MGDSSSWAILSWSRGVSGACELVPFSLSEVGENADDDGVGLHFIWFFVSKSRLFPFVCWSVVEREIE